jgi:hypothetical protein
LVATGKAVINPAKLPDLLGRARWLARQHHLPVDMVPGFTSKLAYLKQHLDNDAASIRHFHPAESVVAVVLTEIQRLYRLSLDHYPLTEADLAAYQGHWGHTHIWKLTDSEVA